MRPERAKGYRTTALLIALSDIVFNYSLALAKNYPIFAKSS